MTLGSIRHEIRIRRPAATVWEVAGDATRLHEWFPGIVSCQVDGNIRAITLGSGVPMPEEILVVDDIQRIIGARSTSSISPTTHASSCTRPKPTRARWH
jgi:uncharacterized protein YndB with AHSA1/START domain